MISRGGNGYSNAEKPGFGPALPNKLYTRSAITDSCPGMRYRSRVVRNRLAVAYGFSSNPAPFASTLASAARRGPTNIASTPAVSGTLGTLGIAADKPSRPMYGGYTMLPRSEERRVGKEC